MSRHYLPCALLLLGLSGCVLGPDYQRPESSYDEQWQSQLNTSVSSQPAQAEV